MREAYALVMRLAAVRFLSFETDVCQYIIPSNPANRFTDGHIRMCGIHAYL